jgi:hypothetical protein
MMVLQRLGGEVMLFEHPLNAAVIDDIVVAVPDYPRQLTSGEGMRKGQTHDVLLKMPGQEVLYGALAPRMGQGAPINEAQEPIASKALSIPPQPPILHPSPLALLPQRAFTLQHRADGLIPR